MELNNMATAINLASREAQRAKSDVTVTYEHGHYDYHLGSPTDDDDRKDIIAVVSCANISHKSGI